MITTNAAFDGKGIFFLDDNDLGKVRNDEFLKKIMNSVKDKLADEEEELLEDEDPFSCV